MNDGEELERLGLSHEHATGCLGLPLGGGADQLCERLLGLIDGAFAAQKKMGILLHRDGIDAERRLVLGCHHHVHATQTPGAAVIVGDQ